MVDVVELCITCGILIAFTYLAEFSNTLAAALATAPVTTTVALILYERQRQKDVANSNGSDAISAAQAGNEELSHFTFQIIKGISASLLFAVVLYTSVAHFKWQLIPALGVSYAFWTLVWFMII